MRKKGKLKAACAGISAVALAASLTVAGGATAFADTSTSYWQAPTASVSVDNNLLKTYGVRAGSAGPDFVGVSNTNFDVNGSGARATSQAAVSSSDLAGVKGAGLALWATSVNENPNPFYVNLYYSSFPDADMNGVAKATTWSSNPETSSWGDSNGLSSTHADGSTTINGLEYSPEIIFGANKSSSWDNFDYTSTNFYKQLSAGTEASDYDPTFVNNDSTNLWTQIYTIGNLATTADNMKDNGAITRYDGNSATTGAVSYEKALRGNLLYIASQIDQGNTQKKTVAYLYAIDGDTGYFFIPEASGLVSGNDTGKTSSSAASTADANYAANNGTIDLDYMDTLPFITNTFTNGTPVEGGIVMKVEDIYKANPAVSVGAGQTDALAGVDTIIFNTTTQTNLQGTSGGKNESGINNSVALTKEIVSAWAADHGFTGTQVIAGDDFGTSGNQGFGTVDTTADGMSPMLYCQRNYTTDKPARAAWAFSKVYPELYPNEDASYAYWVDKVYHINTTDVATVVKYMTNQSDDVTYTSETAAQLENDYAQGLNWWLSIGVNDPDWNQYAYYTGSTRASYYDGDAASEIAANSSTKIGIFAPSTQWATPMYRLYNSFSGEHFYTADAAERDGLVSVGWSDEGVGWYAPSQSAIPVYRLYNPYAPMGDNPDATEALGDHHYTTSLDEYNSLVDAGWIGEGVGFYSDPVESHPLFREYNPNAYAMGDSGAHNYTTRASENDGLVEAGWSDESDSAGIWAATAPGSADGYVYE